MNGWVYEGYIDTIIDVFNEVDGWIVGGLDRINSGLPDYKLYPPTHFRTNTMKNSNSYKTVDIFYLHKKNNSVIIYPQIFSSITSNPAVNENARIISGRHTLSGSKVRYFPLCVLFFIRRF